MGGDSLMWSMFSYLDHEGTDGKTASAEIVLTNGEIMTIRAGGANTHCYPAFPPYESYEVLMDHAPERFWRRYTDSVGMLYADVPRLLVAHHITRHGGIEQITQNSRREHHVVLCKLSVFMPEEYEKMFRVLIGGIKDAHMISTTHQIR
jgi:hypothetical protein